MCEFITREDLYSRMWDTYPKKMRALKDRNRYLEHLILNFEARPPMINFKPIPGLNIVMTDYVVEFHAIHKQFFHTDDSKYCRGCHGVGGYASKVCTHTILANLLRKVLSEMHRDGLKINKIPLHSEV